MKLPINLGVETFLPSPCAAFARNWKTYIFAEAVLLQQTLHESALHGWQQVLRVEAAEAGPVGEKGLRLPPDGGRGVGELQQRQVGLLHPLQDGDVLPLGAQHPAPEQVELTERMEGEERGRKGEDGGMEGGTHEPEGLNVGNKVGTSVWLIQLCPPPFLSLSSRAAHVAGATPCGPPLLCC